MPLIIFFLIGFFYGLKHARRQKNETVSFFINNLGFLENSSINFWRRTRAQTKLFRFLFFEDVWFILRQEKRKKSSLGHGKAVKNETVSFLTKNRTRRNSFVFGGYGLKHARRQKNETVSFLGKRAGDRG